MQESTLIRHHFRLLRFSTQQNGKGNLFCNVTAQMFVSETSLLERGYGAFTATFLSLRIDTASLSEIQMLTFLLNPNENVSYFAC